MAGKEALSLGKSKEVYGYKIKKMPLGAYLRAMERLEGLPGDFMETCFPGMTMQNIFNRLKSMDDSAFSLLLAGVLRSAPKYVVGLASELFGIEEEKLTDDENIGLDGLADMAVAFAEVNGLGKLPGTVRGLVARIRKTTATNPGSSG